MAVKKLEWDSEFFGFEIGEVNFGHAIDNSENYKLLYVKNSEDFEMAIEGFSNTFSEQKIKFFKKLLQNGQRSDFIYSHKEVDYQIDDIFQLAYESGKQSRFLLDKKFTPGKFEELYRQWITNSISKDFADDLLLYIEGGKTVGLVTYSVDSRNASVGLIAIDSNQQGRGLGGILLGHLEAILYENGIESLTIPTQKSNKQACHFYEAKGYSISEENVIKHYWKD